MGAQSFLMMYGREREQEQECRELSKAVVDQVTIILNNQPSKVVKPQVKKAEPQEKPRTERAK